MKYTFRIGKLQHGQNCLAFLTGKVPGLSRQRLEVAFHRRLIQVNGIAAVPEILLMEGDLIEVDSSRFEKARVFPEDIPLAIAYEDPDLLVVHKPAGMACHAGLGIYQGTLLNALQHYYLQQGIHGLENGLAHRLDRLTSGLIIAGKSKGALLRLSEAFAGNKVKKTYHALLLGELEQESGTVDMPIGRRPDQTEIIEVRSDGKKAITRFKRLDMINQRSLVEAEPVTGRTHQLRIHFSYLGHPICGDPRYGTPDFTGQRLHLCAVSLELDHPFSGKKLKVSLEKADF